MVDEHYYESPAWFIHNQDYYNRYDRAKSKVYLGEYACRWNTLYNALGEGLTFPSPALSPFHPSIFPFTNDFVIMLIIVKMHPFLCAAFEPHNPSLLVQVLPPYMHPTIMDL